MNDTPLSIAETRETFIREDGSSYTRSDVFVKLSVTFRDKMLSKLKGPMLSIFLCISLHCNSEMKSWPSMSTISEETGYSRQAVIDAIKKLVQMGLIERYSRTNQKGDADSNLYRVKGFFSMGDKAASEVANEVDHEVVNQVDHGWSTTLTTVVNQVDPKKIPSKKNHTEEEQSGAPSAQPPAFCPGQFALGIKAIQQMKFTREQWTAILEAERARGDEARATLITFIEKKLSVNQHPAVQVYRDETHYYPPAEWGARIAAQVGANGNLELWREVVAGYVGCGWNPRNVKAMLEHFARGEVPSTGKMTPLPHNTAPVSPRSTELGAHTVARVQRAIEESRKERDEMIERMRSEQ
jgi:DNA-binding Lrp family transcriptional regulator